MVVCGALVRNMSRESLIARSVAPVALLLVGLLSVGAAADEPAPPPAPVSLEILGKVPELRILRRAQVIVRITNHTDRPVPDVSPEQYAAGKPALYLGAWFADERPSTLGTFEVTRRLRAPLPPRAQVDVVIDIRPGAAGRRFLALGLLRASGAAADYGEVGRPVAAPADVQPGAWHENHRVLLLKGIAFLHLGAFLLALAALALRSLRA